MNSDYWFLWSRYAWVYNVIRLWIVVNLTYLHIFTNTNINIKTYTYTLFIIYISKLWLWFSRNIMNRSSYTMHLTHVDCARAPSTWVSAYPQDILPAIFFQMSSVTRWNLIRNIIYSLATRYQIRLFDSVYNKCSYIDAVVGHFFFFFWRNALSSLCLADNRRAKTLSSQMEIWHRRLETAPPKRKEEVFIRLRSHTNIYLWLKNGNDLWAISSNSR